MARKPDNDDEPPFEEADLAVAELADGAFDAAFDAVTMDDGEEVDLAAEAEKAAEEDKRRKEANAAAEAAAHGDPYKRTPTQAELMTGVGLESVPDDAGEAADDTLDLPAAEELEQETGPAMPPSSARARPSRAYTPAPEPPTAPAAARRSFSAARPDDADEDAAVQGRLEQLRLVEIVQMMEFGKKSAWVEVEPDSGGAGELGFKGGMCTWALYGELGSDEGFCSLCEVKEGKFRIYYGSEPGLDNIESPTQFLLLEALRRIDEDGRAEGDVDPEDELDAAFMGGGSDDG